MSGKPAQNLPPRQGRRAKNTQPKNGGKQAAHSPSSVEDLARGLVERELVDRNSERNAVEVALETLDALSDLNMALEGQLKSEVELLRTEQEKLVKASEVVDLAHRALHAEQAKSARLERELAEVSGELDEIGDPFQFFTSSQDPMKIGPVAPDLEQSAGDILGAVAEHGEGRLHWSDGNREISALLPVAVVSEVFVLERGRVVLNLQRLLLTVLPSKEPIPDLAGVALVIDGNQVAYSRVAMPIALTPGLKLNIAPNVVFG